MSVPAGFTGAGLPVGIQIVGRHRDEWSVLQIAHAFEQATRARAASSIRGKPSNSRSAHSCDPKRASLAPSRSLVSSTSRICRRLARRRLPDVVFAYIDGGAEDEVTLARQRARVSRGDVSSASVRGGADLRPAHDGARNGACAAVHAGAGRFLPHVLSARRGLRRARGERSRHGLHPVHVLRHVDSRKSGKAPAARSGISSTSRAAAPWPKPTIARAKAAGYTALVVTIDTPVAGHARARLPPRREASAAGPVLGERAARRAVHHAPPLGDGLHRRRRAAGCFRTSNCRMWARCPAATSARCSSRRS